MPRVEIDEQVFSRVEIICPRYLSPTGFINLLLEQHVDRVATLGAESSEAPSKDLNLPKSINKPKSKKEGRNEGKKRTEYPLAFEQFWRSYQRLPEKASKQSKPLALIAWEDACVNHPAGDLQRAVDRQLQVQQRELNSERGFTVAMPDCFRWLRDECFVALLENHTAATESRVIVCDEAF